MAGHLLFPKIDEDPVPFSNFLLESVLREKLGFQGVVVSDDLNMKAIKESASSIQDAVVRAFGAGIDVLMIVGPVESQRKGYDALLAAVHDGTVSRDRVDQAVQRILSAKQKIKTGGCLE